MMFFGDFTSGNGQEYLEPHFFPYNQVQALPQAVVNLQRSFAPRYSHTRHLQHYPASSSSRTAKSGLWSSRMPPKRTLSDSPSGTPGKIAKTEQKPEDFSNHVKKKLQSSTRTGQACDRCKVRKIRCDGLLGGCSPCLQNQTECRTTDRITGRAAPRGYVEGLERENQQMSQRIRELEHLCLQNGIDIKPSNAFQDPSMSPYPYNMGGQTGQQLWGPSSGQSPYTSSAPGAGLGQTAQETNLFRALPTFRAGCIGDNYLGVSSGNSQLSSIKGTALSILGMEIDIANFTSNDMDEPDMNLAPGALFNKSYQAFLQSTFNVNPKMEKPALPGREEGFTYAQWYFRVLNPYCPILHKGTFMNLLARFYDDANFRPTPAQIVNVHMVFAIMFFQYATRNYEDAEHQQNLTSQSNMHYHYALGHFYQLACSHTYQDVQALTLICAHLRNFPKPGASWILTSITMNLAIELGMHRSVKRWAPEHTPNPLDIEMRKRTFWSIYIFHVTLSGKLGRPMPLRSEDWDVEFPDPIDDDLLTETGLDTSRPGKCIHMIGLTAWRIGPLYADMYNTIYAVRRTPENYIETVNNLEARLRAWQANHPPEVVRGESGFNEQEGRVFALYLHIWALEFRLLLRHPAVSMTVDPVFNAESMKICVESARQMLDVVVQLQKLKSLDTTWYNTSVYVMAITITLFAAWDRRSETTTAELSTLRTEMDTWLEIMGEMGNLLGSGPRLREAVRQVTDGTLHLLSRSLQSSAATPYTQQQLPPSTSHELTLKSPQSSRRKSSTSHNPNASNGYGTYSNAGYGSDANGGAAAANSGYSLASESPLQQQTPYPPATQYSSYPDPTSVGSVGLPNNYASQQTPTPDMRQSSLVGGYSQVSSSYNGTSSATESVEAPLLAAFAAQAAATQQAQQQQGSQQQHRSSVSASDASQQQHLAAAAAVAAAAAAHQAQAQAHHAQNVPVPAPQTSWQQWTNAMSGHGGNVNINSSHMSSPMSGHAHAGHHTVHHGNLDTQDRYSASALMQLGGGVATGDLGGSDAVVTAAGMASVGGVAGAMTWPLNIFDLSGAGGGQ